MSHEPVKAQYNEAKVHRSGDSYLLEDVRDGIFKGEFFKTRIFCEQSIGGIKSKINQNVLVVEILTVMGDS